MLMSVSRSNSVHQYSVDNIRDLIAVAVSSCIRAAYRVSLRGEISTVEA